MRDKDKDYCFGQKELRRVESFDDDDPCIVCLAEDYGDYSLIFSSCGNHRRVSFELAENGHRLFPIYGPRLHLWTQFAISNIHDLHEAVTILQESGRVRDKLNKLRDKKRLELV